MTKFSPIYLLLAGMMLTVISACNSKDSDDAEIAEIDNSDVAVKSFALAKNDSVLARLDSVFFSIDLNRAVIFNADSLPVGTDVSRMVLNIGLPSVSAATIIENAAPGKEAKTYDYLASTKDSIDFSHGDVTLRLVSGDKAVTRDYTIKVNVHRMKPDSLYWNHLAVRDLPGNLSGIVAQKTIEWDGKACCLVSNGSECRLSLTDDPGAGDWTTLTPSFPVAVDVTSFTTAGDKLYILSADGALMVSTDGVNWDATDASFHWLYGDYDGALMASRKSANGWEVVKYPSMEAMAAPEGFPVEGTSEMVTFDTEWSESPLAVMVGGETSTGELTGATWGYDGEVWSALSIYPLAVPARDVTLVPYFTFRTNKKSWVVTRYSVLLAFGGTDANGAKVKNVSLSYDCGMRWKTGDDLMQLPAYIPAMSNAQALVFSSTIKARTQGCWTECEPLRLPLWWEISWGDAVSRATAPIDEWDCPYIYLFGGMADGDRFCNTIWRGVVNRLTFRPLQ